jgi:uncharacterized cupredoxin-like copper-binding protein
MPHRRTALAVSLLTLGLLGGCGGPAATPTGTPAGSAGTPVAVTLTEFAVAVTPNSVAAGPITFAVANSGTIEHELVVVGPTGLGVDQLPSDNAGDTVDVEEVGDKGKVDKIAAGSTATLKVTLPAGSYVLICNIATHYDSGMRVAFTVH